MDPSRSSRHALHTLKMRWGGTPMRSAMGTRFLNCKQLRLCTHRKDAVAAAGVGEELGGSAGYRSVFT
jgi:hypothetical protein